MAIDPATGNELSTVEIRVTEISAVLDNARPPFIVPYLWRKFGPTVITLKRWAVDKLDSVSITASILRNLNNNIAELSRINNLTREFHAQQIGQIADLQKRVSKLEDSNAIQRLMNLELVETQERVSALEGVANTPMVEREHIIGDND